MMNMNWIEREELFPKLDPSLKSYFTDCTSEDLVNPYHFDTIPEMTEMIKKRLPFAFSEKEILEIAKTAFRCRAAKERAKIHVEEGELVDFIYPF